MATWNITPRTLALFHVQTRFIEDVIEEMQPWLERVTNLRRAIYDNATDPARKDQLEWMQRYERMLVARYGDRARFLPPETPHDPAERKTARNGRREPEPGPHAATVPIDE